MIYSTEDIHFCIVCKGELETYYRKYENEVYKRCPVCTKVYCIGDKYLKYLERRITKIVLGAIQSWSSTYQDCEQGAIFREAQKKEAKKVAKKILEEVGEVNA